MRMQSKQLKFILKTDGKTIRIRQLMIRRNLPTSNSYLSGRKTCFTKITSLKTFYTVFVIRSRSLHLIPRAVSTVGRIKIIEIS